MRPSHEPVRQGGELLEDFERSIPGEHGEAGHEQYQSWDLNINTDDRQLLLVERFVPDSSSMSVVRFRNIKHQSSATWLVSSCSN